MLQDVLPEIFNFLSSSKKFDRLKTGTATHERYVTAGVYVEDGIIRGGENDGEPLFTD